MKIRRFFVMPIARLLLVLLVGGTVLASTARLSRAAGPFGATFLNQETNTASASLQIDSAGGLHAAYVSDPQEQAYYSTCAPPADCANIANWTKTHFGGHVREVQLALTPQGQPRMLLMIDDPDDGDPDINDTWWYAACESGCTSSASWSMVLIGGHADIDVESSYTSGCGNGANWAGTRIGAPGVSSEAVSLRLDSHSRPRMAVFFQGSHSRYLWCDSFCTDGARWGSTPIDPIHTDAGDPDLQLDQQDRPRIAFQWQDDPEQGGTHVGIGYAWCDTNCESPGASFQRMLADDSSQLDTDWPLAWPSNCPYANWLNGYRPSLALDAAGQPWIAADADFVAFGCVGVPQPGHGLPVNSEKVHDGVRSIGFAPGSSPRRNRVFLPFARR